MKITKYLVMAIMIVSAGVTLAQPGPPPMGPEGGPMREKLRERINTMKVWKLTEEVGLTPQQSEKFFPIYNKFQKAMDDIEMKRGELVDRLESLADSQSASNKDIAEAMAAVNDIPRQMLAERDKFIKDISTVLPLQQQAKLAVFEERFKQRLQEFIRDMRQDNRGGRMRDNQ